MADIMDFPDTVEEFMEQYKVTDTKRVYSNGTEYVPIFRMKQWLEHIRVPPVRYATLYLNKHFGDYECSACGEGDIIRISSRAGMIGYCPYCGAKFADRIGFKNR